MLEYGTQDTDTTAAKAVRDWLTQQGVEAKYLLHHPRMPVDARPCRLPMSLRVQALLVDGRVVTAFQAKPGATAKITIS